MFMTMQVRFGFPSFYKLPSQYKTILSYERFDQIEQEDIRTFFKFLFVIAFSLFWFTVTNLEFLLLIISILAVLCGIKIRKKVKTQFGKPLPWVGNIFENNLPIFCRLILKKPMLVFDIWTILPNLIFVLLIFFLVSHSI